MNQETLEALKGSIEKWEKIVAGTGGDAGHKNCALCGLFNFTDNDCVGCPIWEKTNMISCNNTPYERWFDHHISIHDSDIFQPFIIKCKTCERHAKAEVKFLKSLLPEDHNETSKKGKS